MTLTADSATLIHDATGTIISQSSKEPDATLWPMQLQPATTISLASNVVRHEINADFVAFGHASFFSPTDSAMYNALLRGYLGNFPALTAKNFNQNKPNAIATAKGHLKQRPQRSSSTACTKRHVTPAPSSNDTLAEETLITDEITDEHNFSDSIITSIVRNSSTINYSDLPGRFPFVSHLGHEYMLLSVYRGYIHIELLKNRESAELVRAYRATYDFFERLTIKPAFQMLDNEKSNALDKLLKHELKVTVELVPPNCHRRNRAERAIQDWKAHFIAGLATVDPNFPIQAWNELVDQGQLTINHLRPYTTDRTISAYEGIHGKQYDFLAHPIYPPGVKIIVLEPAEKRESWAPHGLDGFYIGPAPDTYQSFRCWINSTNSVRISDSISVHPHKLRLPGSLREDIIYAKLIEVQNALSNSSDTSVDSATFASLANDLAALTQKYSATEQRVPPAERAPPAEQRVPQSEALSHPTASRAKARKKEARTAVPQYDKLSKSELSTKEKLYADYLGRCYTDSEDGHQFQITAIVTHTGSKKDKSRILFYRYYDTNLHATPPTTEDDFEHTPCIEMIHRKRNDKNKIIYAPYIKWSFTPSAASTISTAPKFKFIPDFAYSTYHSSPTDQQLNVTADGKPLTHRNALKGPDGDAWRAEDANEFRRLMSTSTIRPIFKSDKPADKTATYYNPQVKEKLDSVGNKKLRTRGTLGGDRCNYDGPTSSPVADISVIKTHIHSVVSDRRNHRTDTRYVNIDIKDFYLGSKLDQPDFVSIAVKDIPEETMLEFDLQQYVSNDAVLFQVDGTMYGHPVAGRIANADLVAHLAAHGYIQDPNIPCLFTHSTNRVSFTLVVDDFGIKYTGKASLDDLIRVLELKYVITVDLTGQKYVGIRLAWDYNANTVTLDMPTTIPDAIARFLPNGPRKKAKSPGIYVPPNYMAPDMGATVDDSPFPSLGEGQRFHHASCGCVPLLRAHGRLHNASHHHIYFQAAIKAHAENPRSYSPAARLRRRSSKPQGHLPSMRYATPSPIRRFALIPGQRRLYSGWHPLLLQLQRQPH